MTLRLWAATHPYYASPGCYYSNDCHQTYESWADFIEDWASSDEDYNLLYRWDWHEGDDYEIEKGAARLELYFMLQRKARPLSVYVSCYRENEPEVREYLAGKWRHLQRVWSPFGPESSP